MVRPPIRVAVEDGFPAVVLKTREVFIVVIRAVHALNVHVCLVRVQHGVEPLDPLSTLAVTRVGVADLELKMAVTRAAESLKAPQQTETVRVCLVVVVPYTLRVCTRARVYRTWMFVEGFK